MIQQLRELEGRNLIREMEKGGFVRLVLDEKTGTSLSSFEFSVHRNKLKLYRNMDYWQMKEEK